MDDLRAAVDRALALTPGKRLIAIDASGLVDAADRAVYAAFGGAGVPSAGDRRAVADPLRLPLIEGVADIVVTRLLPGDDAVRRLREVWRILAPAGVVVLIVPLPPPHRIKRLIILNFVRRRIMRWLDASMFTAGEWQTTTAGFVVRAAKCDGLVPPVRLTHSAPHVAPA